MQKVIPTQWIVIACLLVMVYIWHQVDKRAAVNNAITLMENQQTKELLKANKRAEEASVAMREEADKAITQKDEDIANVRRSLNDALERLSKRDSRTKDGTYNPSVAKACTGAELYREDGQFLRREAARADELIIERDYYYNEYERIRKRLDAYQGATP